MRTSALVSLAAVLRHAPPRGRAPVLAAGWSDAAIACELGSVPVFGVLLSEEAKLYGTDGGGSMIYSALPDAHRVLAQLQTTYPDMPVELQPLALGNVLVQCGALSQAVDRAPIACLQATVVGSPAEQRTARQLLADGGARAAASSDLGAVPVFHLGALVQRAAEEPAAEAEPLWPLLFRRADVDTLWAELGGGEPMPEVQVSDLAALIELLRSPTRISIPGAPASAAGAAGEVREVPGKPLICAPLDAVEFMREYDRAALTEVTGAVADSLRPLPDDADDADGGLNLDILLPSGQGPWGGLS